MNDKEALNFIRRLLCEKALSLNSLVLYIIDALDQLNKEQYDVIFSNLIKARDLITESSNIIYEEMEKK